MNLRDSNISALKLQNQNSLTLPSLEIVDQLLAEQYLDHYISQAWHIVEPHQRLRWGWHIDAIVEHLVAVFQGQIKNLLINIPPRHMKSLEVSVFAPTWKWISDPWFRFLFTSYAEVLSTRDSLKRRRIIQSPWYQERWGSRFHLVGDQNQKQRFENNESGVMLSTSVEGVGTGEGADGIIIDDPHNVKEAESAKKRESVLIYISEVLSTRLNDLESGWKIMVMQRCHENDASGHVLKSLGWDVLCLPARYEGENRSKTSLYFQDPRTEIGEPLWKERYPEKLLKELEDEMSQKGPYAVAAQLQQRPVPRGGGEFKREDFIIAEDFDKSLIISSIRYWDKAGTQDGGKKTAGVLIHELKPQSKIRRWLVEDVIVGQWSAGKRNEIIKTTADIDNKNYPNITTWVEQEPGSGGKESAEITISELAGYKIKADKVTGSKELRAEKYAAQVAYGNITVLERSWTNEFLNQHEIFPMGEFKDIVDGSSGGFNKLALPGKKAGVW